MIRHCDGTDPNLIRHLQRDSETPQINYISVPCDCGMTFDDVKHFVIYPHAEIPAKPTPEQIAAALSEFFPTTTAALSELPPPTRTIIHEPRTGLCLARTDNGTEDLRVTHVCTRFHEHLSWKVPQPEHRCRCAFTWTDQ